MCLDKYIANHQYTLPHATGQCHDTDYKELEYFHTVCCSHAEMEWVAVYTEMLKCCYKVQR